MEQQQLISALEHLGYSPGEIQLDPPTSTGRVGGFIVSHKFKGKTQTERQEELWEQLRSRFQAEDLTQIVALLTMTPDEVSEED